MEEILRTTGTPGNKFVRVLQGRNIRKISEGLWKPLTELPRGALREMPENSAGISPYSRKKLLKSPPINLPREKPEGTTFWIDLPTQFSEIL